MPFEQKENKTKVEIIASRIRNSARRNFMECKRNHTEAFKMLWNNPNISSISEVQEILNELGADAIKMFAAHAAMGQAIETAESGAVPEKMKSCPVAYEVADGRIILDQNAEYPIQ